MSATAGRLSKVATSSLATISSGSAGHMSSTPKLWASPTPDHFFTMVDVADDGTAWASYARLEDVKKDIDPDVPEQRDSVWHLFEGMLTDTTVSRGPMCPSWPPAPFRMRGRTIWRSVPMAPYGFSRQHSDDLISVASWDGSRPERDLGPIEFPSARSDPATTSSTTGASGSLTVDSSWPTVCCGKPICPLGRWWSGPMAGPGRAHRRAVAACTSSSPTQWCPRGASGVERPEPRRRDASLTAGRRRALTTRSCQTEAEDIAAVPSAAAEGRMTLAGPSASVRAYPGHQRPYTHRHREDPIHA